MEMKSDTRISSSTLDGDEIGYTDQLLYARSLSSFSVELLGSQIGIVSYDVHLERPAQLADAAADTAEAHDAQGLSAKLSAYEFILVPVVVHFDIIVCGNGIPGDLQHLSDGQLSDCVRVHTGSVEYLDSFFLRIVRIDVVGPDRADTDHLQFLSCVNDLFVDLGIHTHDQDLIIPDLLQHFRLGKGLAVSSGHIHILLEFFCDAGINRISDKAFHNSQFSFRYFLAEMPGHPGTYRDARVFSQY